MLTLPSQFGVTFSQPISELPYALGSDRTVWRWEGDRWQQCLVGSAHRRVTAPRLGHQPEPPQPQQRQWWQPAGYVPIPLCYAYGRQCGTPRARHVPDLEAQDEMIRRHVEQLGGYRWAGFYKEPQKSAFSHFASRPVGRILNERARPGDLVVIADSPSAFRSPSELVRVISMFEWMGRHLMLLDLPEPIRRVTFQPAHVAILAAAELQRPICVECNHEAALRRKARGMPVAGRPPYGYKFAGRRRGPGDKDKRYLVHDEDQRAIMQEVVRLRDDEGLSFPKIGERIAKAIAVHNGRPLRTIGGHVSAFEPHRFPPATVKHLYDAEKKLQGQQIPVDPRWEQHRRPRPRRRADPEAQGTLP